VPAIQNLLPSIGFEKMKNKYALSAQFDLELCCGNGGGGGGDNGDGDGDGDCEGELITWYRDADSDGFGNPNDSIRVCEGVEPEGYVLNDLDSDDTDLNINPDAP